MKKVLFLIATLIILNACSTGAVLKSKRIATDNPSIVSNTTGGYYSLPRIRIRVDIQEKEVLDKKEYKKTGKYRITIPVSKDKKNTKGLGEELNTVIIEPDPHHFYALNYLANSAANDTIKIYLTGSDTTDKNATPTIANTIRGQFLEKIDVSADDKTASLVVSYIVVGKKLKRKA